MAKVKITGHASGTGIFTVTAPNSNTDRTITLPDGTGTLAFTTGDDDKLPLAGGTMTGDLILGDNVKVEIGSASGGDLQLYHDATNSYIHNATGNLYLRADTVRIQNAAGNETLLGATADGASFLAHNDATKLTTTATGVTVTGVVAATTLTGDGSALTGLSSGLAEADVWRVSSNTSLNNDAATWITANWERANPGGTSPGLLGTGVSQSSGVFTLPSTGYWLIHWDGKVGGAVDARYIHCRIYTTVDNSTYSLAANSTENINYESSYWYGNFHASFLFDCTNTSTHKVKFQVHSISNSIQLYGGDGANATFIKLGDT